MPAILAPPIALDAERLRWGKYSAQYRKRLLESGRALHSYLHQRRLNWNLIQSGKSKTVDDLLVQLTRDLHEAGLKSGLRIAKHAILLVQILRPRLRRGLQGAWEAVKSWEELSPSHFRPPVPLPVLACLTCKARIIAEQAKSQADHRLWLLFSAFLLIGFYGLLRPGEMLNLRQNDIMLPNTLSLAGDFAVTRIQRPKNSRQMGIQQYVEVRHPDAINWLSWMKSSAPCPDAALWPSTANRFRRMFKHTCTALNLGPLKLSPASLRAGGATWLVDEGLEIGKIRFLGRWAHMRSLEHYIQVARAQQIALEIVPSTAVKLKEFLRRFFFLLRLPHFLEAQVDRNQLVHVPSFEPFDAEHAVFFARSWGRLAQSLSQSGSSGGPLERGEIHRSELGRLEEVSKSLQARPQIQPVRQKNAVRKGTGPFSSWSR